MDLKTKRQYSGSKGYWIGTQITFSGKNAAYFYKLIKTQRFDWDLLKFDGHRLSLGRIDLCFSRFNCFNRTTNLFDEFLVNSSSQIQNCTNTRHIRLQDFPDGKMLKVNRRNNSVHYRIYQKDQRVRFEIELKHRQTKLVQDYLFQNQFDVFEHQLVTQYFQYSKRILCLDYPYTDWVLDFQRRYRQVNSTNSSLLINYLENQINSQETEERLFHLVQVLSFIKKLGLTPSKKCKPQRIKKQNYYFLKFPLNQFVRFIGIQSLKDSQRKKLILYFKGLQKLDPVVKEFSSGAFRSYVCFPYVECENPLGNSWSIEVLAAEELFYFQYPFQLPELFLRSVSKNDLRLKMLFLKSLAVSERGKKLDLEEFFSPLNVRNSQLIQIKKNILQLLNELVVNRIIQNEMIIVSKSGKERHRLIKNFTTSDITRRIKYIKLTEMF